MTEQDVRRYLRQMRDDDSQLALKKFYDLCYDRFYRIAWYYLHDDEAAQDIVLDVFFRIWQRRQSLHEIANLEDYFFITVRNAALARLEQEKKQPEKTDLTADILPDMDDSPEEILIGEELFARYVKALDRLPPRCREVFIRVREDKQSYAEVAAALDISVHTVDAQLQKAIARLREMLFPDE